MLGIKADRVSYGVHAGTAGGWSRSSLGGVNRTAILDESIRSRLPMRLGYIVWIGHLPEGWESQPPHQSPHQYWGPNFKQF